MTRKKAGEVAEEEEEEEDGVEGSFFYINRDGFPIKEETWDRMYEFAAKNHPLGDDLLRHVKQRTKSGSDIPVPNPPGPFSAAMSVATRLEQVQNYMSSLKYNHTGTQFFEIKKARPISGLMECAKEMIKESLPIKCLEALVLGTFLTNDIHGLLRFNISFKTLFQGGVFRHVVLGIYHNGKYGALGMSRRKDLMYKPLKYESLSSLVKNFLSCYNRYGHLVRKLKIGNKITKDPHSFEPIPWKGISLEVGKLKEAELFRELERHSRDLRVKNPYENSPRMPAALPKTTTTTTMPKDSGLTQSLTIPFKSKDCSRFCPSLSRRSRSFATSASDLTKTSDGGEVKHGEEKSNSLHRSQTFVFDFADWSAEGGGDGVLFPDISANKRDSKMSSSDTNINSSFLADDKSKNTNMSYKIRI